MSIIDILNDDCLFHVNIFLDNDKCEFCNFRLAMNYQQKVKCKFIQYEDLICCINHNKNIQKENVIKIMNQTDKKNNMNHPICTIHFMDDRVNALSECSYFAEGKSERSENACKMAKKYFSKYGEIDHFCCGGRGVCFKNNSEFLQFNFTKSFF